MKMAKKEKKTKKKNKNKKKKKKRRRRRRKKRNDDDIWITIIKQKKIFHKWMSCCKMQIMECPALSKTAST